MFSTSRVAATLAAALLVTLATTAATAQETVLQNDSFISGQSVGFQAGFVTGEIAASRFLPSGSPSYIVKRIQLLFGGATTSQAITLRIWNDSAGTTIPGAEQFSGDFLLTGSNTALQEIDLVSSNVIVTGQFRVGIEFQHDGLPSVAADADGTIQATRNFIFAKGFGWTQSNLLGLNGDWVIRAVVVASPCTYSLSPIDLSNTAAAGASPSITVTTPSGCPVTATSFQPWVTVNGITPNGNTTTVALTVSANAGAARATAIVVADRLYLITQLNP
jgi:hypothetical protein